MLRTIAFLAVALLVAAQAVSDELQATPAARKPEKIYDGGEIHNVFRVHPSVYCGGQPYGDAGFDRLKKLGVRTVITVDGAKPDVATAKKYDLRYVHLPHGYDGVPEERVKELAKALRELDGPFYIHCHHGKHRSPAAAAAACVAAGLLPPEIALPILEAAGTSKSYRGLYESAEEARVIDPKVLEALKVEFREVAEIPALAEAMVEFEHRFDYLKQLAANGWKPPPDHPDVAPAHEALMLREHMTELLRTDEVKDQPAGFRDLLSQSEKSAYALEAAYGAWHESKSADDLTKLNAAFEAVNQGCVKCHADFRDVPLHEKGKR